MADCSGRWLLCLELSEDKLEQFHLEASLFQFRRPRWLFAAPAPILSFEEQLGNILVNVIELVSKCVLIPTICVHLSALFRDFVLVPVV